MPQQIYGFPNGRCMFWCVSVAVADSMAVGILPLAKTKTSATMTTQPHTTPCSTSAPSMIANKQTLPHCRQAPISSSSKGLKCLFCPRRFKNMRAIGKHSRWYDGHYRAWFRHTPFEWSPSARKAHLPVSTMVSLYLLILQECLILLVPHFKYHILQTINNQIIDLHHSRDGRDQTCWPGRIPGGGWIRNMQTNAHHFTKSYWHSCRYCFVP